MAITKAITNFTPGPWKLETESRNAYGSDLLVTTPDGAWNIADCRDHSGLTVDSIEHAEANALLIASAPELYTVLDAFLSDYEERGEVDYKLRERAQAVLDKAVGR